MLANRTRNLPTVLSTSVVRGAYQGQSHGGLFLVDLKSGRSNQVFDWDNGEIDFAGRGADRGLRGIAFRDAEIFIAASDEIFVFDQNFNIIRSYRNRYLKHCHEISLYNDQLFLTSTGFDSILVLNVDSGRFEWGLALSQNESKIYARTFDPNKLDGPALRSKFHLNNVFCNKNAVIVSGLKFDRLIRFGKNGLDFVAKIPMGTHNAQVYKKGLLYNDTERDRVVYFDGTDLKTTPVPSYSPRKIINEFGVSTRVARPGFARGLCPIEEYLVAAGSSPSTISVYDLHASKLLQSVNLSMDVRNAIHGLELWPYN